MNEAFNLHGTDLFGNPLEPVAACKLADDFIVPPFSVLNAREGGWQERKRKWLSLGIQSELGRGDNSLSLSVECQHPTLNHYRDEKRSGGGNLLGLSKQCEQYRKRSNDYQG